MSPPSALLAPRPQAEPYHGEILETCPAGIYDFVNAYAVVVSGARYNPCGHMLLNAGGPGGWYFHVAEVRSFPRYMGARGYQRYLQESGKRELSRTRVPLTDPAAAMARLEELLSQRWTWFVLPHNCAHFVEEVLQAGGSRAGLWTNCPAGEAFR
jgi:hypothetical protein